MAQEQSAAVEVADEVVDAAGAATEKPGFEIVVADPEMAKLVDGVKTMYAQAYNVAFDLSTVKGDTAARRLRKQLVASRTRVETVRKERNADLRAQITDQINQCNLGAAALTKIISDLEGPLDAQIRADEQRREDERRAREEAERQRLATIRQRIQDILDVGARAVGLKSPEIQEKLDLVVRMTISAEAFEEQQAVALDAKNRTVLQLQELLAKAKEAEEREAQAARDRAELDRLRAEKEERARAERVAEQARLAEQAQAQAAERQRLEKIAREQDERAAAARRRQALLASRLDDIAGAKRAAMRMGSKGIVAQIAVIRLILTPVELEDMAGLVDKARDDAIDELAELAELREREERQAADREATAAAREAEATAERERVQHNEMLMSEIAGIREQLFIAQTGRVPYYRGANIADTEKILQETRDWPVTQERFGVLFHSAEAVKSSTIIGLEQYLEQLKVTPPPAPTPKHSRVQPAASETTGQVEADTGASLPEGAVEPAAAETPPDDFAKHALALVRDVANAVRMAKQRPDRKAYVIPKEEFLEICEALTRVPMPGGRFGGDGVFVEGTER